jgi:hypothetical protein
VNFETPPSLKAEHEELHDTLGRGTKESGELGAAANVVAQLMHPHFLKEEEYALPPLGLLGELAQGVITPDMKDVLVLTDRLKADLGQMLAEHQGIVRALAGLSAAARDAGKSEYAEFAAALTLHAQTEEEVTYPTAILIGDYVAKSLGTR